METNELFFKKFIMVFQSNSKLLIKIKNYHVFGSLSLPAMRDGYTSIYKLVCATSHDDVEEDPVVVSP